MLPYWSNSRAKPREQSAQELGSVRVLPATLLGSPPLRADIAWTAANGAGRKLMFEIRGFRFCPILFSNGSMGSGSFWATSAPSGVCVLYVLIRHLMGSAGCRAARLKSQSAKRYLT